MKQEYSSADTSLNQVSRAYTTYQSKVGFKRGSYILDYGGGKYDAAVGFMRQFGCTVKVYDPFNRSEAHNRAVISYSREHRPDYIINANVLNVIKENDIVDDVVKNISRLAGKDTLCIFCVYEGSGTGHGTRTTKGWQRNQRTASYVPVIQRYFKNVERRYNLIFAWKS